MVKKRILVIDDEFDIREVIQCCLEEIGGWEVITASSGYEALVKVSTEQPDAILLDVMMPGMDGLTFLKELRTSIAFKYLPVVLVTAKVSLIYSQLSSDLNVAGIINKPFNPILLSEQVGHFLHWQVES